MLSKNTPPGTEIVCIADTAPMAAIVFGLIILTDSPVSFGGEYVFDRLCTCAEGQMMGGTFRIAGISNCCFRRDHFRPKHLPSEIVDQLDVVKRDIPELIE